MRRAGMWEAMLRRGLNGGLVGQEPYAGVPTWHLRTPVFRRRSAPPSGGCPLRVTVTKVVSARRSPCRWGGRPGCCQDQPLRLRRKTKLYLCAAVLGLFAGLCRCLLCLPGNSHQWPLSRRPQPRTNQLRAWPATSGRLGILGTALSGRSRRTGSQTQYMYSELTKAAKHKQNTANLSQTDGPQITSNDGLFLHFRPIRGQLGVNPGSIS